MKGESLLARRTSLRGNLSASEGAAYCCRLILCHPTNHIVCVGAAPFYRATAPRHAVWPSIYLTGRMRREKKVPSGNMERKKISRFEMKPLTSLLLLFFSKRLWMSIPEFGQIFRYRFYGIYCGVQNIEKISDLR